jgi:hypothetical protein
LKSISSLLIWLSILAVLAVLSLRLTSQMGFFVGFAIYTILTTSMTGFAGWLLHRSEPGEITWRNRLAGTLLPWSMWVGSGSLTSLLTKNAAISAVFGCLIAFCNPWNGFAHQGGDIHGEGGEGNGWTNMLVSGMTLLCWIVLLVAWLRLLQNIAARPLWPSLGFPPMAVGTSIVLRYLGMPWLALTVVAMPIFLVLLPVTLMIAGLLMARLTGKPVRWN